MIVAVPAVEGVKVLVHVAVAVVPDKLQALNVPVAVPETVRATEPVGVVAPVREVSITVAVQSEPWLITTGVVGQATLVVVGCGGGGGMLPVCVVSESAIPALATVTHRGGWLEVAQRVALETKLMVEVVAGTAVKLYFTRKRRPVVGATV